jgi:hypothetical protein
VALISSWNQPTCVKHSEECLEGPVTPGIGQALQPTVEEKGHHLQHMSNVCVSHRPYSAACHHHAYWCSELFALC